MSLVGTNFILIDFCLFLILLDRTFFDLKSDIAAAENISPKIVADGIGQALYTTAFGLVVAVIIQFGQNTIMFIIDNLIVTIQKSMTGVTESISKKNK